MGILEDIKKMKNRGMGEEDIVRNLQEKGISPREINDAIEQTQIKSAVSDYGEERDREEFPVPSPGQRQKSKIPKPPRYREEEFYTPQPLQNQSQNYSQNQQYPSYQKQEEYYPQESYEGYESENYIPGTGMETEGMGKGFDSDTIIEISEQVFSEKITKIKKQIDELEEFKTLTQSKLNNISRRLEKIESTIDKLQMAILEKVSSYGRNVEGIKKEMSMMQDSFAKMVPSLVARHEKKLTEKPTHKVTKKTKSKTQKKKISKKR